MAETFPFRLITPTGVVFDGPVESVVARSPLGEFGVLPNHIDFITSLVPCVLRITIDAERASDYVVTGGLAAVRGGALTVLASEVQKPERLDRAAAANEAKAAEDRLGQTSFYAPDYAEAENALMLARARERAAELRHPAR
jgi:F-type H+-transporting ATPase subunit epsilon